MAFINEFVSREDVEKYDLSRINEEYFKADLQYSWTVDRERNIYLRYMREGREEQGGLGVFAFFWGGRLLEVQLFREEHSELGGKGVTIWGLRLIKIPDELLGERPKILSDLKEALVVYKDFGIRSVFKQHTAKFEF